MKICIINNIFYPYSRGGADKIARSMFDGFLAEGDEVFFIATEPRTNCLKSGEYRGYFLSSLFFNLKNMPKTLRLFWHIYDMFNILNYYKIKNILKIEKPDLVISHNLKGIGFLTPRAIAKQKIKHYHVLHDIQLIHPSGLMMFGQEKILDSFFCQVHSYFSAKLFKSVDAVISPSKWLLEVHKSKKIFLHTRSFVIPNPVKLSPSTDLAIKNTKPVFLFVGEIEVHKGVKFLIDVAKEIHKNGLDFELILIGAGTYSSELEKEAEKFNFIKYLGKQENIEVMKQIKLATALIMPSLCYENSPTVIYEACQQKTPVIASRIGGITELIHHLGGVLFNPGDKDDLIKKIEYTLSIYDKVKHNTESAQEKIKEYNISKYIKQIKEISNQKSA